MYTRVIALLLGLSLYSVSAAGQTPSPSPSPSASPSSPLNTIYTDKDKACNDANTLNAQFFETKSGLLVNGCDKHFTHPKVIRNQIYNCIQDKDYYGRTIWRVIQSFGYTASFDAQTQYGQENHVSTCQSTVYTTSQGGWDMGVCYTDSGHAVTYTDAQYSTRVVGSFGYEETYNDPVAGNLWYEFRYATMYFKTTSYSRLPPCVSSTNMGSSESTNDYSSSANWDYVP